MTKVTLVIDASVIVKAIVTEDGSPHALRIVESDSDLLVPAHCLAEVAEVLVRKIKAGQASADQIDSSVPTLRDTLTTVPIDDLMTDAMRMSLSTGASVYGCLYVALAAAENCPLVTADNRLMSKMKGTRFAALLRPLDSSTASP